MGHIHKAIMFYGYELHCPLIFTHLICTSYNCLLACGALCLNVEWQRNKYIQKGTGLSELYIYQYLNGYLFDWEMVIL
jgi:hypothetical protein